MFCLSFQHECLIFWVSHVADYLKQCHCATRWLGQACWSQMRIFLLLQELCDLLPTHLPYVTSQPRTLSCDHCWDLTNTHGAQGQLRYGQRHLLNKSVIWLGQSRQISTLTSIEILPQRHSPCRWDLAGIISPDVQLMRISGGGCLLLSLLMLIIFILFHSLTVSAYITYLNKCTCKAQISLRSILC